MTDIIILVEYILMNEREEKERETRKRDLRKEFSTAVNS
jgi:hypothetical protein